MARMRTAAILLFLRVFFLAVPDIQSTASLVLDGSTSTVVPLPSLISALESSFGTTVGVSSEVSSSVPDIQSTASLLLDGSTSAVVPSPILISASESSFSTSISVSSEVSSSVPSIQSTSSIILNSSTPAVVPTQSLISEACTPPGEYINASSGHISSLNFSHNYEANRTCTWNITVLSGKIIKLTFLNFTLVADEEGDCTGAAADSARVFITNVASHDGNPDDFKICGQTLPHPVYSKGNSIQVRFESRNSILNKGFNATFEAIDGDSLCPTDMILNETSGSFSSPFHPRNYPFNQKCSWKIIGKQGYRVELTIPDYNLQPCGGAACSCDYMEVQNSFSDEALPGKLCAAPTTIPVKFYSLHESLRVVFVSDDANMDNDGFGATYKLLDYSPPICPNEAIPLSGSGKISSTNYPKSNYTASRDCTWNITAPADKIVKFTFTDFVLSECSANPCSDSCSYVELYDGGSTTSCSLGRFCQGSFWNESQFSSGNQMFVMFHPGKNVDRGFEAKYECTTANTTEPPTTTVPCIQSTQSISLDSSIYATVPSPILISSLESSFGTTIGVSSEVSSFVPGIQSTSSLPLDSSTSAVVPSPILISASESISQSQRVSPSAASSIGKSFPNSSIEQVSASPSFSSHESVRTSSSLPHGSSTPSMETSRIATPSSVVDRISLCECPCDTSSTFSAEKSPSVSDSESHSSFVSMDFAQTASVSGKNSWSLYDSESLSSSTSMVFAQTASFSGENSSSVYVSKNLSSSAPSVFTQSPSVYAENSWSVYGSESLPLQASSSLMQDSSVPGRTSSLWYDSRSLTSSASSVGLKTVSSTDTYKISSSSTSSVCYCPCNRSTVFPSPSSSMSISASKTPSPMYPYGPQQKDNEFGLDDSPYYYYYYSYRCGKIQTDWTGIPFFSERHYKLYICRNGMIQLNYDWSWWWPRKFGIYWWFRNMGIIAPFWATTDTYFAFRYNHSKVYYQVYNQTHEKSNETLAMASEHVKSYTGGFDDFEATWVLVVTWEKLCPYAYYPYYYYYQNINEKDFQLKCSRSNTFQAVLITNGFNTFLMYNYPFGGIQWVVDADPNNYRYWTSYYGLPVAGWNAGNGGENYFNIKGSGTFEMYDLDKKEGNTGVQGRYFWRIENSDGQGALEKCFSWVLLNEHSRFRYWYKRLIESDREMACPCTVWQAWFDWGRFRWSWWNSWPDRCFDSRRSRFFYFYTRSNGLVGVSMRQKCCYSTEWEDWGSLKQGPPDGGRVEVTLYYYWYNRVQTFYTDEEAYQYCCVDLPFCHLFYAYRPSDSCSLYRPPIRRWFWGDPHIKSLDGGNYTFNGLGEYTMVDAENGTFNLQARTKLAQGNSTTATIFSAGAAKEKNSSTIEVRVKDGGGLHILIDSTPYNGYKNLTNRTVEVGRNLSISKPEENCLQVSFPSTSSVQFCENKEMMSFVVTLGDVLKNATKGLLGTWNDDPNDDFTLPNGTVLPSTSSLKEIHYGFGVKWQINQSQSLFTYADNESVATYSDPEFEPMFADNIKWHNDSLKQKAEAQCGNDHECLFDVASTKDLSIGSATKAISVQLVNDTKKLNNFPPKIVNTSEVINVTLHEIVELNITAVDDGTITFRVINKPVGATWNQTGAVLLFYWNATSSKKFSLTFVAVDDQDASAIWSPIIKMCACQHDGQCVEPEEGDANNTDSKFIYMGCECQGGYTGRFCDRDIDACEVNGQPCYAGVDCTDLPPPANSTGYECGPCPSGYNGDGAQCVDIDECQSNPCKQKCVNVPASFFCDCDNGYKLNDDGRSCGDIDECRPTNDCMQKCDNSVGSYNCSCDEYFKTDPTDWRKCVAKDPCTSVHGCSHVCFKGSSGRATCACYANFELQSDGKTCKDINECDPAKELHRCSQTCINTEGSYKCSCTEGYELKKDGYECEDINECLNDDLYSCTDDFHKCVNTRGSYKCECEQDLYFIDGKCQGLENGQPPPKQPPPKPKNASEYEKEQAVQFSIPSRAEWDFNRDKSFKEVLARVASDFCSKNRTKCGLKNSRRNRRSLYDIYTADEVHLLPGYPKNSSDSLQVAFYVKQPAGGFIGNNSVLHRDTLVFIIITHKSDIEKAIGANITDIETLFKPSTTTESPTAGPAEPADDDWKWIVIGVVIGVVVIILIGLLIFCIRKRKRDVKPITDPSQEGIAAQQSGLKKENSFESGSHSA